MTITYGRVPIYPYVDRFIKEKVEGFGWDDLGKRNIKFVTLHRMVGTLRGTDSYFRMSNISSYTDFGIGTATSDPALAGTIYLWNYPDGRRAPWASGPVNKPYGDGAAIVTKYGINAVNRDGLSLEIGGTDEPIDDFTWNRIVWFIAYWADQCKIPYTSFPINPETGISFIIWHNEFTNGTGKQCPFPWLRNRTSKLIEDVKNYLKGYQEGTTSSSNTASKDEGSTFEVGAKVVSSKNTVIREGYGLHYKQTKMLDEGVELEVIADGEGNSTVKVDSISWVNVKGTFGSGWTNGAMLKAAAAPIIDSYKQVNDVEFYYLGEDRNGRDFTLVNDAWSHQWASEASTKKKQYKKGEKVHAWYFAIGAERNNEQLWLVLGEDINTAERLNVEDVKERPF